MIVWGGTPFGARYCAQCLIDPPQEVSATPTVPNQITVSWTAVPDAIAYNVYKKYDGCGQQMIEWRHPLVLNILV